MEPVQQEPQTSINPQEQTPPPGQEIPNTENIQPTQQGAEVISTPKPKRPKKFIPVLFGILFLLLVASAIGYFLYANKGGEGVKPKDTKPTPTPITQSKSVGIITFKSDGDFKEYLKQATSGYELYGTSSRTFSAPATSTEDSIELNAGGAFGTAPERVSETNVQVAGIDEADIVKTDGKNIFYSSPFFGYRAIPEPMLQEDVSRPEYKEPETQVIGAFPPSELKKLNSIKDTGDMLLVDNILAIFSGDKITAYNVSDPSHYSKTWSFEMEKNNQIVTSRLFNKKIYLVIKTRINTYEPCPVKIFSDAHSVKCTDVYRPNLDMHADSVYSVMQINPESGKVEKSTSLIGSDSVSTIYMSPNAVYITYTVFKSFINLYVDFFIDEMGDVFPQDMISRMREIREYNISMEAKMVEFSQVFEEYETSLDEEDEKHMEEIMQERIEKYMEKKARDMTKTGIAKVDINDFTLRSTALLPGMPLNQFSLDEYQDHLRFATTVGAGMFGSSETSANDVYILNKNLNIVGQILNLGLTERIYSARFIADKGYIVTFRQIDPFYVLDLSDPINPQLKGELKIPGYSSYLHPINKDKILGIGKEDSSVKISLFDVANPENPFEADKLTLEEYWSDILNTHHAFLIDDKHKVFFIPGGRKGYVISYSNDNLEIKHTVDDISARRALYINNYLYVLGNNKIVVIDENTWKETNKLEL